MFLTSDGGGGAACSSSCSKEFYQLIKCIGETRSKQEEDRILENELQRLKNVFYPGATAQGSANAWTISMNGAFKWAAASGVYTSGSGQGGKEIVCRALYCHMLGHDIRSCVNICSIISECSCSSDNWFRYLGYVLVSQILKDDDDALLLLVNTIQKDLTRKSSHIRMAISLNFMSQRISTDSIPLLYNTVVALLDHPSHIIRKKSLNALTRLVQKMPRCNASGSGDDGDSRCEFDLLRNLAQSGGGEDSGAHVLSKGALSRLIHERNHSVLLAYLNLLEELYRKDMLPKAVSVSPGQTDNKQEINPEIHVLITQLVSILKKLIFGNGPLGAHSASGANAVGDDVYHRVSSPWLQTRIMRLLVLLINKNPTLSQECYEVLRLCLITISPSPSQNNICYALQYECILTICGLYPHPSLCRLAANVIKLFLESENRNLRLCGINALINLVDIDPNFIAGHELIIIDSLNDTDSTIQIKALKLLTHITNTSNVLSIIEKLLATVESMSLQTLYSSGDDQSLGQSGMLSAANSNGSESNQVASNGARIFEDEDSSCGGSLRRQVLLKSYQLIDRYAPSSEAYIETVAKLIKTHPKYFDDKFCLPQFVAVVSEGLGGEDEDEEAHFRALTLRHMLDIYSTVSFRHNKVIEAALWAIAFCCHVGEQQESRLPVNSRQGLITSQEDSLLDVSYEEELGAGAAYTHAPEPSSHSLQQNRCNSVDCINPGSQVKPTMLKLIIDRFANCFREITCSRSLRFMVHTILQICGQTEPGEARQYLEPLMDTIQNYRWDAEIDIYYQEYKQAAGLNCLSSLYPVMGYTEDVSRYVGEEVLESCITELGLLETPEMLQQLATQRNKVEIRQPNPSTAALNLKPYEDVSKEKPVRLIAQTTTSDFAVKDIGSRWSVDGGLRCNELRPKSAGDPTPSTVTKPPITKGIDFQFVTRHSNIGQPRKVELRSTSEPPASEEIAQPAAKDIQKLREADKLFAGVI